MGLMLFVYKVYYNVYVFRSNHPSNNPSLDLGDRLN